MRAKRRGRGKAGAGTYTGTALLRAKMAYHVRALEALRRDLRNLIADLSWQVEREAAALREITDSDTAQLGQTGEWVTTAEAARILSVHPATVRRWAAAGTLPSLRTAAGLRVYARPSVEACRDTRATSRRVGTE